jgi:hypothetical protein
MTDLVQPQKVNISRTSLSSRVASSIMKERCNRTRLLYAGPGHTDTTLVVYRLAEMFRGRYYLEETIYDVEKKSFKSYLSSLNHEKFHKVLDPVEFAHALQYKSPETTAIVTYTRELDNNSTFRHSLLHDDRKFKSMLSPLCDIFLRRKLFSYMNKN